MVVVSDTSPLNYLALIDRTSILPALFGSVVVPDAVAEELAVSTNPAQVRMLLVSRPEWLSVRTPETLDVTLGELDRRQLDRGELAAISLAIELNADVLLCDERSARIAATKRSLRVVGTLGALDLAARRGLLDLRQDVSRLMTETNFRASETLLAQILRANP